MASAKKKKVNSKVLTQQKRRRRQWITFVRMCRYGVNNFTRNAWLTIAATAIMTITLFVVLVSVATHNVLIDTVDQLRDQVSMSIYLDTDTDKAEAEQVVAEVRKLSSVVDVTTITPEMARDNFIQKNRNDPAMLEAVKEASNKFFWTLDIKIQDINDTSQLANLVAENEIVKEHLDPNRESSFSGSRRVIIENIANGATLAQRAGIAISAVFMVISMLIIFNTIRMAIFNRREEIQMMKLIGAERSFIRGPFLVEAIVYGFFAALIATAMGYGLLVLVEPALASGGINIQPTHDLMNTYVVFILLSMIVIGAVIGIISSLMATSRYLKL